MRKSSLLLILFIVSFSALGQSYNQEKIALKNYLMRMYLADPFEGVKIVSDYDNNYLVSVVLIANNSVSESAMNRIAQVKSQRQTSQFLGGVITSQSETIVRTTESIKEKKSIEEIVDIIKENSIGFTKAMEVLAVIDVPNDQKCYMFYRKVEEMR